MAEYAADPASRNSLESKNMVKNGLTGFRILKRIYSNAIQIGRCQRVKLYAYMEYHEPASWGSCRSRRSGGTLTRQIIVHDKPTQYE